VVAGRGNARCGSGSVSAETNNTDAEAIAEVDDEDTEHGALRWAFANLDDGGIG
jgi:hypothetical protein